MKTTNVSVGITRDERVSNHHTARTLDIENKDGQVGVGVSERGQPGPVDALEIGQKRRIGGIEIERKNENTLVLRDATLRTREIPLADLGSVTNAGERQVLANFAAGIAQAAAIAAPPALKSDVPKVQELLDQGFAENLARIVRGEAGARLSELKQVYELIEQIEMTPAERARLAEVETLLKTAHGEESNKLFEEKWNLEEKKPTEASLIELRRLILQQIDHAGFPADKVAAIRAGEAATRAVPKIEDFMRLLSGELYLPQVSGALRKNILAAEEGRVWIQGTTTPNPYSAADAFDQNRVFTAPGLSADDARAFRTELAIYSEALRFEGPDHWNGRFELMRAVGTEALHRLRQRFEAKGDGGFYAQRMLTSYVLARPSAAKSIKEFFAKNDDQAVTRLAYAYNDLFSRAPNSLGNKGIDGAGLFRLVSELRFDQFAKLVLASYEGDNHLGNMLAKHGGVDGLISLAKRKSADELIAMAREARGKEAMRHFPEVPPADPQLVAQIGAPPFEEVSAMARALGDCGLSREQAKLLHAIIEKHLAPDWTGVSKGGGYTLEQMNAFWSSWPGSMGVVTATPEHIGAYGALTAMAGHYVAILKAKLADDSRGKIVDQFASTARAKEGTSELLTAASQAIADSIAGMANPPPLTEPAAFAQLLAQLADPQTTTAALDTSLKAIEARHRMESTVHNHGTFHSIKAELAVDAGHKIDVDLVAGPRDFTMRFDISGGPRREDHQFAELQTLGDGARYHFGGALLDGDHPTSKLIGARMFAQSLPHGVPHLLSRYKADSAYERRQLESVLMRSTIELARIPEAELHAVVASGPHPTPAAALAAMAARAGFEVDAKTLDHQKLAELGARIYAETFAGSAIYRAGQIAKDGRDIKEGVELLAYAFDALRALPAAERNRATKSGKSIAEAITALAESLGMSAPADLSKEQTWRQMEAKAYAALFAHEASMLSWRAQHINRDGGAKVRAELGDFADRIASLDQAALEVVTKGTKQSPVAWLREVAGKVGIEDPGTVEGLLAKIREAPERTSIRAELEDPLRLGSDLYVWIVPEKKA